MATPERYVDRQDITALEGSLPAIPSKAENGIVSIPQR
jgi:hypothetical protein